MSTNRSRRSVSNPAVNAGMHGPGRESWRAPCGTRLARGRHRLNSGYPQHREHAVNSWRCLNRCQLSPLMSYPGTHPTLAPHADERSDLPDSRSRCPPAPYLRPCSDLFQVIAQCRSSHLSSVHFSCSLDFCHRCISRALVCRWTQPRERSRVNSPRWRRPAPVLPLQQRLHGCLSDHPRLDRPRISSIHPA